MTLATIFRKRIKLSALSGLQLFQLFRAIGFALTGMAFAKIGISKTEIGKFENFLWLNSLLSFFWIAGLMNTMLSIYSSKTELGKEQLLRNTFQLILLISSLAGLLQLFMPGGTMAGTIYLILNNCAYLAEYILYFNKKSKLLLYYGIASALLQFIFCLVPAYIYIGTDTSILGLVFAASIRFAFLFWLLNGHLLPKNSGDLGHLFFLSLPLTLSFFVSGSADYIDGAVVKHYFSLADFGIFRYGARDFPLFNIMASTLSMSLIPAIADNLEYGLQQIRNKSLQYMHFIFPISAFFILSSKWLFIIFFSQHFEISGRIFAALMLLTIPRMLFPQAVMIGLKENRYLLIISIIEMLINLITSIFLARTSGLIGVAYGTVVAFIAEKLIMAAMLYIRHHIRPSSYLAIRPFLLYSVFLIACYLISNTF